MERVTLVFLANVCVEPFTNYSVLYYTLAALKHLSHATLEINTCRLLRSCRDCPFVKLNLCLFVLFFRFAVIHFYLDTWGQDNKLISAQS